MRFLAPLLLSLTLLPACSESGAAGGGVHGSVEALRARASELAARPEHTDPVVQVQHVLISFKGAPKVTGVTRSLEEAEQLAADVLARVDAGEDFGTLVEQLSDDPGRPGIYTMVIDPAAGRTNPGAIPRQGMVPAFGDVAWRLAVGEVGVAPHDAQASPFGWHVIKRLK